MFVGRQPEMAELRAALDDAISGQGRLVMIAGEPGIGKTRTAQELASYAQEQGVNVLWGWCHEEVGAPPYWPWFQAIRSYVQECDAERLRSEMGPGAANIAGIVPEIHSVITSLEPPPALEPEAARFRLFDSITIFLKNASQSQPLMLVLDDLHWADGSSLRMLQFLARELAPAQSGRLLVVGCYRDMGLSRQHPLSETLAQLSRSTGGGSGGGFRPVALQGLAREDTRRFIEASAGIEPTVGLVEALYSHTGGNPFFMTEVIRLLSESGELTGGGTCIPGRMRIPQGVRAVIGQRLNRLSERCNEVLATASIIGREFDFRLLNIVIGGTSEDQLFQAMDEAVAVHLIEDIPGQMDRYQFRHTLFQQTLAEEVTTSRKVRLHAKIGEALEELYGENAGAHAAELAHHFAGAQTSASRDKLARYSLLAGERALAADAHEDALAHLEKALTARDIALPGTETAPDEEAAALLFGLARAQSAILERRRLGEAFAILSRAFEFYFETRNVALAVSAAEFPIAAPGNRIPGVAKLIARALTLVPAESHEAGRLLSRYGGVLGAAESDYEGAHRVLGRAIAIARRERDAGLEVRTLTNAAVVSGQHLHWQECIDHGLRAIELAAGDESTGSDFLARWWTTVGLLMTGDSESARRHAVVLRDVAESRSIPRQAAINGSLAMTYVSCLEGDWNVGRESNDRGLEAAPLDSELLWPRVMLECETGDIAQAEEYLDRLLNEQRRTGPERLLASLRTFMVIAAIARITGDPGRLELAAATAETARGKRSVNPLFATNAKTGLALLAVHQGDGSAAEEHYSYFLGQRGTMIWTVASVDRLLGLLAQTTGNLDRAADHFEDALDFCRNAGYRPELAWSCCDYGDILAERAGQGDGAMAVALLDESLAISKELGMRPLTERVNVRLARIQVQTLAAQAFPSGLTPREVEVIRLIASGKTNPEIATELIISVRTVANHVASIFRKTGSATRAAAAAYATRNGLG